MSATIAYTFALKYETHISTIGLWTDKTWTTGAPQPWWGGGQPDDPPSGNWAVTDDEGLQVTLTDTSGNPVGVLHNCNLQTLSAYDAGEFESYLNGRLGQWIYPPVGESAELSDAKQTSS